MSHGVEEHMARVKTRPVRSEQREVDVQDEDVYSVASISGTKNHANS